MRKQLYRFISFEDFINLVINNKDRFVQPSVWDDGYEGYLFSSLDSPEDVRHIVSEMYYNLCPRNYFAIPDNYFRMWHSNVLLMCSNVRNIEKQMLCRDVIHMGTEQLESGHERLNCLYMRL